MFTKIKTSLKNINYKLFFSLLVMGLCPTIYTTLRVFYLGDLPGEWAYSIAGQLSWVNLIYEIINEAIILPLFYFVGKVLLDKKEFTNRVKTGLIITLGIYLILTILLNIFIDPLLRFMATDTSILEASSSYIRIESIANIFIVLSQFMLVALVSLGKEKKVYILTFIKLILCMILDLFLVSNLSISLSLGVNGIAISNIIVNALLFFVIIYLIYKEGINVFNKDKLDFSWSKEFFKVGGISGIESFVRNIFYMVMISRMVNVVGEQGTYWVCNNFIWGWLLLPISSLGELIKQEVSTSNKALKRNSLGYFALTFIICLIWIITIPLYKPFMTYVLNYSDVDKLFNLVMILLGFYILYAIQNVFDSTFYGLGKTNYMLFESIVTNIIYYGICFILYITKLWTPSLIGIALMFGIGNAFDSIVSFVAYKYLLKKNKINILE